MSSWGFETHTNTHNGNGRDNTQWNNTFGFHHCSAAAELNCDFNKNESLVKVDSFCMGPSFGGGDLWLQICRFVVFRAHHKCIINIVFFFWFGVVQLSAAHTVQTPMHRVVIILCDEKYNSFLQSQAHHPFCAVHGLRLNFMGYILLWFHFRAHHFHFYLTCIRFSAVRAQSS